MDDKVFLMVEDMPRFPGCEDETDRAAKRKCSDKKLVAFLYDHLQYPAEAREIRQEGTVVVQFTVEKDGSLSAIKVVRNISEHLDAEALRLVKLMNEQGVRWIPGKQEGRPERVQFNLPIRFKLD